MNGSRPAVTARSARPNRRLHVGVVAATLAASVLIPAVPAAAASRASAATLQATVTVPDLVDFNRVTAQQRLAGLGLGSSFSGSGNFVFRQSPLPGTVVQAGSVVSMVLRPTRG